MIEDSPVLTASGPFPPPPATIALLAPGTSIAGRYRIESVLGAGGYAVVYLAFDRELERMVALKVLRPERASSDGLARFRREVAVTREMSSPRLARVFDIGSSENAIFLTMELVEGESLKERLRRGLLPVEESIAVSRGILEGLDALHAGGVVHRDVKPGNVLLGRAGEIKLADFGLARSEVEPQGLTHSGAFLGTSEYVAPEQALGEPVDARSDLYSLGVVMFEMLTGRLPFPAESALGVLLERLKARPPDPRRFNAQIPRWLARMVLRLLERRPGDRYRTASEVLRDLARRRSGRRVRRPAALVLTALALVLAGAGILQGVRLEGRRFSHLVAVPKGGVAAISRRGETLWSTGGSPGATASAYALARISRSGPEVVAAVAPDSGGTGIALKLFRGPRASS